MVKNIILLTGDALRADHVSCYGYERETTPNIDEIADQGLMYKWAFSASSHTREAIPAILTGRYPQEAVRSDLTLNAKSVAAYFTETHATAAFHSNPYVSRAYGYGGGFDIFDDDMYLGTNRILALAQRALNKFVLNRGEYHARAEKINKKALKWLDSLSDSQPFFLWNHYMDSHGPYNPPNDYLFVDTKISNAEAQKLYHRLCDGNGSKSDHELAVDLYDDEIRYLDSCIGAFIDAVKKGGYLEDTLLIFTADHGDLFGEHGKYGHPRYVYRELTHVPLILYGPTMSEHNPSGTASTIDIVPTVLEATDTAEVTKFPGRSVLTNKECGCPVYSSATAEGEHSGLRRFAAWDGPQGYRLTRKITDGEVVNESIVGIESGFESNNNDVASDDEFDLRASVLKYSGNKLSDVDESENESNAQIQERLEELGYK